VDDIHRIDLGRATARSNSWFLCRLIFGERDRGRFNSKSPVYNDIVVHGDISVPIVIPAIVLFLLSPKTAHVFTIFLLYQNNDATALTDKKLTANFEIPMRDILIFLKILFKNNEIQIIYAMTRVSEDRAQRTN